MEELQDAIEDAQYVNAISTQEDGPRPVLAWDKPTELQREQWRQDKLAQDPRAWTLEWVCQKPIGLFLFSSFLKEERKESSKDITTIPTTPYTPPSSSCRDYVRINFCEEVIRFKKLSGPPRLEKARWMATTYLRWQPPPPTTTTVATRPQQQEASPEGNSKAPPLDPTPSTRPLPPKSEIDECDLARPPTLPPPHLSALLAEHWDYPVCSQSWVGVKGPVLQKIFDQLNAMEQNLFHQQQQQQHQQQNDLSGTMASQHSRMEAAAEDTGHSETTTREEEEDEHPLEERRPSSQNGQPRPLYGSTTTTPARGSWNRSLGDRSAAASVRSLAQQLRSDTAKILPEEVFDEAELLVMESLRRQYWEEFQNHSTHYQKMMDFLWFQDRPVVPADFCVMRVLGRGGFGLVQACKKATSGKLYAMKIMNKRRIKMRQSEQLALNERRALAAVESNFVVNLKYSFHSKDDIYLILDLMTGGDLGFHLHQKGRFPKKECLYYAARIMLGLQALHDKKYVYRDLKPENCLLAEDGRVKITDLGLATKITPNLKGAAGTRGYWAPEMLRKDSRGKRIPYGHTVDWFSFGCCVAEFISGTNPFRSGAALSFGLERGHQTKEKALDCATLEMEPELPSALFEPDAADLCRRLLEKDETKRLGFSGCEEIMVHPWFKGLNWEAIISDRKRPPFVPAKDVNAASQSEIGNFVEDQAYQATVITEADEEVYKDWDWTNPHAFSTEVIEFLIYERETGEPLLPIAQTDTCCCVIL